MGYLGLQSVCRGNSAACIQDIFQLHFSEAESVADVTYGAGRFWKWDHGLNIVGLDLAPNRGAAIGADYRHIPLQDKSIDVLVYDPPFIFTRGIRAWIELRTGDYGQKPKGPKDLREHTLAVFHEARRVARKGMILKGMDPIANKPYWWLTETLMDIGACGLQPEDMLVQIGTGNPVVIDPRWKNQYHFRRVHTYYIIYKWED